jgi:uncharacterized membrane protein YjfL (UPF0719 family)
MSEEPAWFFFHIFAVVAWLIWLMRITMVHTLRPSLGLRWLLVLTPLVCALILWMILRRWASHDVVDSPKYLYFYTLFGAAWVGAWRIIIPLGGLHVDLDAIERRNAGAAIGIAGALVGLTLAFAGGNIGDGPGYEVVFFSALLSTATFFLLWQVMEFVGHFAESITIERETGAGLRLAGALVGVGAILGYGVAGDWVGFRKTIDEFYPHAGGAAALALACGGIEEAVHMGRGRVGTGASLLLAVVYTSAALGYVAWRGWVS